MKKFMLIFSISFLLLLLEKELKADVPEKIEQLVYTIIAFNGKDYTHTFCRENEGTFYLIADKGNFITVRKTFIYYWPITKQWNAEYDLLNEMMDGHIELREKKSNEIKKIDTSVYTYFNIRGEYESSWKIRTGADAYREIENWKKKYNDYIRKVEDYHDKFEIYRKRFNELLKIITDLQSEGEDISKVLKEIDSLEQPKEPVPPQYYNIPPASPEEAFIFNLPEGEYFVKFIMKDGTVLEGSEKKVITFTRRRKNGIGFEIIPGDKWTKPVQNKNPRSVLYINGSTDLFLRPFIQDEYNDLYYNKMVRNDSTGNINLFNWLKIQQVPDANIGLLELNERAKVIMEEPFMVEQVKGSGLGYRIVPFEPEGKHEGGRPNLIAFHIPITGNEKRLKLCVRDRNDNIITGSERQIRIIHETGFRKILLIYVLLPVGIMIFVLISRRKKKNVC